MEVLVSLRSYDEGAKFDIFLSLQTFPSNKMYLGKTYEIGREKLPTLGRATFVQERYFARMKFVHPDFAHPHSCGFKDGVAYDLVRPPRQLVGSKFMRDKIMVIIEDVPIIVEQAFFNVAD